MKLRIIIIAIVASFILVACNNASTNEENSNESQEAEDIKQLVHDYSIGKANDESASITSKHLIITDGDQEETILDLPKDEFFVSIAPFINETHPCTNHSLTGCQGEMVEQTFDVYIEDLDGKVVIDETMQSLENGFIDLWLPRDQTFRVKITHEGKEVESEISTFESDGTCITTMQLS
ncbi:MAG TPA: CueP family metal-binding protein [Cerasibacillus sp.]|uniref:CueP family metal-binding protein n=1 Tax=Cerasibacillus sp. TaxID=2498711 RepID=UPI002F40504F